MSLPHLPVELRDLIITGLHPTAALALSKTNHFYHSVVSLDRLDPAIVRRFLYDLERRPSNLNEIYYHRKLACYKCLWLRPVPQFSNLQGIIASIVEKGTNINVCSAMLEMVP